MSDTAIAQRRPSAIDSHIGGAFVRAPKRSVGTAVRRAADIAMDVLMLLALVLSVPFVILAVGIPVALVVQLLLRIGRLV